jgi:hypothetical protein
MVCRLDNPSARRTANGAALASVVANPQAGHRPKPADAPVARESAPVAAPPHREAVRGFDSWPPAKQTRWGDWPSRTADSALVAGASAGLFF